MQHEADSAKIDSAESGVQMEMTVMVVAERDIPLAELRNKMLDMQHIRLRQVMYREEHLKPLSRKHRVLLAKLKHSVMGELSPCCSLSRLPMKRAAILCCCERCCSVYLRHSMLRKGSLFYFEPGKIRS